ncbi:MAG TPA: type II toxin-antitoxin system RelE/ParE family toxin [Gemmataceae bacterium]|nr:type II toxin-antitoxin system RelE/ParE family toxin [Gemmataceae bacterium]
MIWTDPAEQDLAALWMAAFDRNAVTSAANIMDHLLAEDPETRGEERFDTVRSFVIMPLGVDFEIIELDRIVYVLSAWHVVSE